MTNQPLGNEENLAKVRELMATADEVNAGGNAENGVPIDYLSEFGNRYKGTVVFKRPTMVDYMTMGGLKSEYLRLGGVKNLDLVDGSVKFMAHVVSTLKVVIVKSPEWLLKVDDILEPDVLYHVYGKYSVWEDSFRKQVPKPKDGDSKASEATQTVAPS